MADDIISGQCLCGAVRFEVEPPTKWCAHCHCSLCRRAHGAAYVTWFGVASGRFEVTAGRHELSWYRSTDDARRGFCSVCGSTMLFESTRWPGEMHIARAFVDRLDREPAAHVFYDDHVSWAEAEDGLRRLGGPTGVEEPE
jgi:hypothetical protein